MRKATSVQCSNRSQRPCRGALGLAFVQAQRGGTELADAERTVRDVLGRNPAYPRAHFLLGMILEQQGKTQDAAASYKKAAQLLLDRSEEE